MVERDSEPQVTRVVDLRSKQDKQGLAGERVQPSKRSFLDLPFEIRRSIYIHLFTGAEILVYPDESGDDPSEHPPPAPSEVRSQGQTGVLGMLRTCHTARDEAYGLFLETATFNFASTRALLLDEQKRARIRHISGTASLLYFVSESPPGILFDRYHRRWIDNITSEQRQFGPSYFSNLQSVHVFVKIKVIDIVLVLDSHAREYVRHCMTCHFSFPNEELVLILDQDFQLLKEMLRCRRTVILSLEVMIHNWVAHIGWPDPDEEPDLLTPDVVRIIILVDNDCRVTLQDHPTGTDALLANDLLNLLGLSA